MKITAVESILLTVPYRTSGGLQAIAGRPSAGLNILAIRLETDQGLTGWGEAFGHGVCPATKTAFDTLVAPLLLGRDPSGIDTLIRELQQTLHLFGRSGAVMYALSGVDIALWDIAGKVAGKPLCTLLGAEPRPLPAYASLLRCSGPEAIARECRRALDQGYRQIKLHEITVPAVKAARDAIGPDVLLMMDTNCPWTVAESLAMVAALRAFDLHWLEEPVWPPEDHAGLAQVRAAGAKIAAGENAAGTIEFRRAFELGALDIAQPSVTKIGGISAMREITALAKQAGVRLVPHCPYFGPGFIASLHLTAALPADTPVERLFVDLEASPFGDWVDIKDGAMRVPQGAGLGADPDPALIARYRTHPASVIQ
ncbi:MAG: mandelate racemase/muconate lactonizing enzyme family protein [Alphaproteobacteria bacterium]|nr:mandelate racemase/muconate lactonizing enzyme family protein [Alphaproteobacteria bacterium]